MGSRSSALNNPDLARPRRRLAAPREASAELILGSTDAMKLRSSMTLFLRADPGETVFAQVLERYFASEADAATDRLLAG